MVSHTPETVRLFFASKSERKIMRKLALRDKILLQIDKAARYIGGEVNAVMKNKDDVEIRFAMAFPDVYRTHLISSTGNNI